MTIHPHMGISADNHEPLPFDAGVCEDPRGGGCLLRVGPLSLTLSHEMYVLAVSSHPAVRRPHTC